MGLLRRAFARVAEVATRATAVGTRAESNASGFGPSLRRHQRTKTSCAPRVAQLAWSGPTRSFLGSVAATAMPTRHGVRPGVSGGSHLMAGVTAPAVSGRRLGGFAVSGLRPEGGYNGVPRSAAFAAVWSNTNTRGYAKEAVNAMKVRIAVSSSRGSS
jgi:hypothetical protein